MRGPTRLSRGSVGARKVLFLGYGPDRNRLIPALIEKGCEVWHGTENIKISKEFDLVMSFGYRSLISKSAIAEVAAPIINLHISYLPYNRGAHPNYWSFVEGTPSGVSIHLIDVGIDTGPVLYQELVQFGSEDRTFAQTHEKLIDSVQDLFLKHADEILSKSYVPHAQSGKGTFHRLSDLPKDFPGWDTPIVDELARRGVKRG